MDAVQGLTELQRTLTELAGAGNRKMLRAAIGATMTVTAKAVREAVNGTPAGPEVKREARKLVGKRFIRGDEGGVMARAKVGFGVGKRTKAAREKAAAKAAGRQRDGVGISSNDIHWFVLGTEERFHGEKTVWGRKVATGCPVSPTGRIKPLLAGAIAFAVANCTDEARSAAVVRAHEVLEKFAK
jgi:hypothetical protein